MGELVEQAHAAWNALTHVERGNARMVVNDDFPDSVCLLLYEWERFIGMVRHDRFIDQDLLMLLLQSVVSNPIVFNIRVAAHH